MRLNNSRGFMANHNFIARVCKGGGGWGAGASSLWVRRVFNQRRDWSIGNWEQLNNDFPLNLGGNSYTHNNSGRGGNSLRCYPHLLLFITRICRNTLGLLLIPLNNNNDKSADGGNHPPSIPPLHIVTSSSA